MTVTSSWQEKLLFLWSIYHSNILFIRCTLPNTRKYNSVQSIIETLWIWILVDQNATGSNKYWVFSKFVFQFYYCVCFVIERSRIDQDDQHDLVFSLGFDY